MLSADNLESASIDKICGRSLRHSRLARCVLPARGGNGSRMAREHTITLRVRYPQVDAMGYLHHSRYLQYFEMGRVELLRSLGFSYAELERQGVFFVVVRVECKYRAPAR